MRRNKTEQEMEEWIEKMQADYDNGVFDRPLESAPAMPTGQEGY